MNRSRCYQAAVCLLFSLLALASTESKKKAGAPGAGAPGEEARLPGVGERVASGGLEFELSKVAQRERLGSELFESSAATGGVYLVIDWTYKNVSGKPMGAFSQPQLALVSPDGTEYEEDLGAAASYATEADLDEKILSNVNPGITVRTAAVFEVAESLLAENGWQAHITFKGEKVAFRLDTTASGKAAEVDAARAADPADGAEEMTTGEEEPAAPTDEAAAEAMRLEVEAARREVEATQRAVDAVTREEQGHSRLAELKGELAAIDAKIASERARWQQALDTINRLTNYKRTPVREGSQEYQLCLAASEVIQEVESGAAELKQEKARLEAMIGELEE